MKAILSKPVPGLGEIGDMVDVSPGYYRNFLVPRKLAVEATNKNLVVVKQTKDLEARTAQREQRNAQQLAAEMEKLPIKVALKAGENDRLFGSVTAADIADKLREAGYEIDKRKVALEEPIKRLGMYTVHVKVHPQVEAKIKVLVEKA